MTGPTPEQERPMLPLAAKYATAQTAPDDLPGALLADLHKLYSRVTDLRAVTLATLWRLARDLVLAIDVWSEEFGDIPGPERMDVALEVAWRYLGEVGGLPALQARVIDALDRVLPRFLVTFAVKLLLKEKIARALVRYTLELAVREMKDLAT